MIRLLEVVGSAGPGWEWIFGSLVTFAASVWGLFAKHVVRFGTDAENDIKALNEAHAKEVLLLNQRNEAAEKRIADADKECEARLTANNNFWQLRFDDKSALADYWQKSAQLPAEQLEMLITLMKKLTEDKAK